MSAKIYLNLLILCGVILQGIIGTFLGNDIDESSDLLVRQKRVINRLPGRDIRTSLLTVPYIVLIKEYRRLKHCPGTILSSHIVITVATCIENLHSAFRVYSSISRLQLNGAYKTHRIMDVKTLHNIHPFRPTDGISLISVNPPFVYSRTTHNIPIYNGAIHPETFATVSGWGCDEEGDLGTAHPDNLRTITVPIISLRECERIYLGYFPITSADVCTLDPTGQRYCTIKDAGAPLVTQVDGVHHLVGIHLWNGGIIGRLNPDVFVNLQDYRYKSWMQETIPSMEASARS